MDTGSDYTKLCCDNVASTLAKTIPDSLEPCSGVVSGRVGDDDTKVCNTEPRALNSLSKKSAVTKAELLLLIQQDELKSVEAIANKCPTYPVDNEIVLACMKKTKKKKRWRMVIRAMLLTLKHYDEWSKLNDNDVIIYILGFKSSHFNSRVLQRRLDYNDANKEVLVHLIRTGCHKDIKRIISIFFIDPDSHDQLFVKEAAEHNQWKILAMLNARGYDNKTQEIDMYVHLRQNAGI